MSACFTDSLPTPASLVNPYFLVLDTESHFHITAHRWCDPFLHFSPQVSAGHNSVPRTQWSTRGWSVSERGCPFPLLPKDPQAPVRGCTLPPSNDSQPSLALLLPSFSVMVKTLAITATERWCAENYRHTCNTTGRPHPELLITPLQTRQACTRNKAF